MNSRLAPIVLALVSAIAFIFSVQGGRWWVIENAEIGPFGTRMCSESGCISGRLESFGGGIGWMRLGMATWGAGLVATFVLLVVAARIASRRVPRLAAKSLIVACATAVACALGFLAKSPTHDIAVASYGRGLWFYVLGLVCAFTLSMWVLRRPVGSVDTPT